MHNNIIGDLIKLSEVFKEGFTVTLNNDKIEVYNDYNKRFIVSYLTIIEINDIPRYKHIQHIPSKCIIGGWLDKDTNTYYIKLNKAFKNKRYALKFAKKWNQKFIYDYINKECIGV